MNLHIASLIACCAVASLQVSVAHSAETADAPARAAYLEGSAPKAGDARPAAPAAIETYTEQMLRVTDGNHFGAKLAVHGDTAVVGALDASNRGVVYVYLRGLGCSIGSGCLWTKKQRIIAADAVAYDGYGSAIAFDGTTIMVGARSATESGHAHQGRVYVYRRLADARTYSLVQTLVAPDGQAEDCFGSAAAVNGTDALIGASFCSGTNQLLNGHGAAYRYVADANGNWTLAQKIVASDGGFAEEFGAAVAITADTAMIGAPSAFQFAHYGVGAVYVYKRECFTDGCNPAWRERQKLVGTPTSTGMTFGRSLAFDGTDLLVGAPWALTGPEGEPLQNVSGAVYAFNQDAAGTWTQYQQLLPSDAYHDWQFGTSVAFAGSTALIGAPGVGWPNMRGGAYVFSRSGATWSQSQALLASDGTVNDGYGNAVGISGAGDLFVGAPQGLNNSGQGTVYVYQ